MRYALRFRPLAGGEYLLPLPQTLPGQEVGEVFLSHKPLRISFSIITFMVPAANLISNFQQYLSLIHLEVLKHGGSNQRMCLHNIKFFFCKLTRLIQNLLINS